MMIKAHPFVFGCFLAVSITAPLSAENLGNYGTVYPIEEANLLDVIYQTLREKEAAGDVDKLREEMTASTKAYVNRPKPVEGLVKVEEYSQRTFDPSIVVNSDLSDHRGVVFAKRGQVVNPLDYQPLSKEILFIDGDDQAQVDFALLDSSELTRTIVLISGAPIDLTKKYNRRFWFDQDAVMVNRFELLAVPSLIYQDGNQLMIEEIYLAND